MPLPTQTHYFTGPKESNCTIHDAVALAEKQNITSFEAMFNAEAIWEEHYTFTGYQEFASRVAAEMGFNAHIMLRGDYIAVKLTRLENQFPFSASKEVKEEFKRLEDKIWYGEEDPPSLLDT